MKRKLYAERWGGKIGSNMETGTAKNRARKKKESVVCRTRLTIENERDKEDSQFQNIKPDPRFHPKLNCVSFAFSYLMQ